MNDYELKEIKERIFHPGFMCNTSYCPNLDGYCPVYECGLLTKLKKYTDKQWQNSLNKIKKSSKIEMYIDDFAEEIIDDLLHKRPLGKGQ